MCAVRACVSYLCIIFLKIVMSVMYVKINVIVEMAPTVHVHVLKHGGTA